jgi:hypothetical protein
MGVPAAFRLVNETYNWEDGESCITGDKIVTQAEVVDLKQELFDAYESKFPANFRKGHHWRSFLGYHYIVETLMNNFLRKQCRSGFCSFDAKGMYFICGRGFPKHTYDDGKSCVDGSEPMTVEEGKRVMEADFKKNQVIPQLVIDATLMAGGDTMQPDISDLLTKEIVPELKKLKFDMETPTDDEIKKLSKHAKARYGNKYSHKMIPMYINI